LIRKLRNETIKNKTMEQKINEVEINGIVYVPKDSVKSQQFDGDIKIVVLQRGWIYIGRFERNGNDCKLHNAYNIRSWGTTKGLPELVNGATSSTKLDKCEGIVEFDWLTVIHTITVDKKSWEQI
jgi:hypothetical protein